MDHDKQKKRQQEETWEQNHNKTKTRVKDTTKVNGQDSCITVKFPEVRATTM